MSYGSSDEPLFQTSPEDAEKWQSPPFFGDFYREPDNVCRGLTLPPEDVPVPGPISFKGFSGGLPDGDFYREPDDICKGISLGGDFHPTLSKDFGFSMGSGYSSSVLTEKVDINAQRFMETDFPPDVPADSFFKLEVTTVYVVTAKPYEIGNRVLDFLQEPPAISTLTKPIRRHKFAIKADIFQGDMMCTAKVRIYNQGSGQFAVEFQRRSGDAIAFSQTFQGASAHLKKHFTTNGSSLAEHPITFQAPPLPDSLAQSVITEADLMPILDMTGLVGAPWLQAEAAISLGKLAEKGNPVLWSDTVFNGVAELIQPSSAEIALPTSRLICNLAYYTEAAPFFATPNFMMTMLDKIRAQESHAQVRLQLAQALNVAVQRQSKATLAEHVASELLRAISDCDAKENMCATLSNEVMQNLREGKRTLESKFEASA